MPRVHLVGNGCDKCGGTYSLSTNDFLEQCKKIHGDEYDYSKTEYQGNVNVVTVICKKHGEFEQMAKHHKVGHGCPKCKSSIGEKRITRFFEAKGIGFVFQKTFDDCRNPKTHRMLRFDFFVPERNVLVEFDGIQHIQSGCHVGKYVIDEDDVENIRERDKIKSDYALTKGFRLIRISYVDINNIPAILEKQL